MVGALGTQTGILALYAVLVMLTLGLAVLVAIPQTGLVWLKPKPVPRQSLVGVAQRLDTAQRNGLVGLALFAPAILLLEILDQAGGVTILAAQLFLLARVVYVAMAAAGIPLLRSLAQAVALLCTLFLYAVILLAPPVQV